MTLLLVPLVLALIAVLVVPRMKAKKAASGGSSGGGTSKLAARFGGKRSQPAVRKFVL
jgi:hypothetical protein